MFLSIQSLLHFKQERAQMLSLDAPPSPPVLPVASSYDSPVIVAPPANLMTPPKSTRAKQTRQSLTLPTISPRGSPIDCTRLSLRDRRTPEKPCVPAAATGGLKTRSAARDIDTAECDKRAAGTSKSSQEDTGCETKR